MPLGGAIAISICQALFLNKLKSELHHRVPDSNTTFILHGGLPNATNGTTSTYFDEIVQSYAVAVRYTFIVPIVAFSLIACISLALVSSKSTSPSDVYEMHSAEDRDRLGLSEGRTSVGWPDMSASSGLMEFLSDRLEPGDYASRQHP
jgi:hypothetical protein